MVKKEEKEILSKSIVLICDLLSGHIDSIFDLLDEAFDASTKEVNINIHDIHIAVKNMKKQLQKQLYKSETHIINHIQNGKIIKNYNSIFHKIYNNIELSEKEIILLENSKKIYLEIKKGNINIILETYKYFSTNDNLDEKILSNLLDDIKKCYFNQTN